MLEGVAELPGKPAKNRRASVASRSGNARSLMAEARRRAPFFSLMTPGCQVKRELSRLIEQTRRTRSESEQKILDSEILSAVSETLIAEAIELGKAIREKRKESLSIRVMPTKSTKPLLSTKVKRAEASEA